MTKSARIACFFVRSAIFGALSLFAASCASQGQNSFENPCRAMEAEAGEMRKLDMEIATMESEVKKLEKTSDAEGVESLQNHVDRLRAQRRGLQYSLERNAADCMPWIHDRPPVRDPARREHQERN